MDGARGSISGYFPLSGPLISPHRHCPATIGILLRNSAIQRRDIVGLPPVSDVDHHLRRRFRLIRTTVESIKAEPDGFTFLEPVLHDAIFGTRRRLKNG